MQYNTAQYIKIQYNKNTIQHNIIQKYNTIQSNTIPYKKIQYDTKNTIKYNFRKEHFIHFYTEKNDNVIKYERKYLSNKIILLNKNIL